MGGDEEMFYLFEIEVMVDETIMTEFCTGLETQRLLQRPRTKSIEIKIEIMQLINSQSWMRNKTSGQKELICKYISGFGNICSPDINSGFILSLNYQDFIS